MNKIIIGIIPAGNLFLNDDPYEDKYSFVNNYGKRLKECEIDFIGIIPVDGKIDERQLDICDGFLVPGGSIINSYHLQVVDYCLKNNKPYLGICLGMQAIGVYNLLKEEALKRNLTYDNVEDMEKIRKILKEEKVPLLRRLNEVEYNKHWYSINREDVELSKHVIEIDEDSILYDIYRKKELRISSMHGCEINFVGPFKVTAKSDNIIEAIELCNENTFVMGVQFHPEVEEENNILFKRLALECSKRKKELIN